MFGLNLFPLFKVNLREQMRTYHWFTRSPFTEVDATCSDFDFGTALHIAASNLCLSAVKCLLELGANPAFRVSYIILIHEDLPAWKHWILLKPSHNVHFIKSKIRDFFLIIWTSSSFFYKMLLPAISSPAVLLASTAALSLNCQSLALWFLQTVAHHRNVFI